MLTSFPEMISPKDIFRCFQSDDSDFLMLLFADNFHIDGTFPMDWQSGEGFLQHSPPYLSVAAYCGAERCVRLLLCHSADANAVDHLHRSVASYAVAGGCLSILRLLDEFHVSFDGSLCYAAQFGHFHIFWWLCTSQSADLEAVGADDDTILHCAATGGNAQIIRYILKHSEIGINSQNYYLCNPLHLAARRSCLEAVRVLLSHEGIDVRLRLMLLAPKR
jgi:ankyrin repeat protein